MKSVPATMIAQTGIARVKIAMFRAVTMILVLLIAIPPGWATCGGGGGGGVGGMAPSTGGSGGGTPGSPAQWGMGW